MRKGNTANARECALSVLVACRRNGAWADAALKAQLGKCALSAQDAALCSRIVYGVMQNELLLTMDNIEAYKGDVTNDQADCGLVFAVQAKPGKAADVEAELNAYKDSLAANDLYAEFADKVAQAKDARIVSKGDCVVLVIAGVGGPDYADIDTAIAAALN